MAIFFYNQTQSPVDCFQLNMYGVYFLLLFVLSVFFNSFILVMYCLLKELRTLKNLFMLAIILTNLFGCFFELPFLIINNFFCKYTPKIPPTKIHYRISDHKLYNFRFNFGELGCRLLSFSNLISSLITVHLMSAICYEK